MVGYTVVALAVAVTLLNIAVAAAMPAWSHMVQHDREEELIFRGLQIAEAIRVFQIRFGRYPTNMKELMKTEPRSMRQMWTNPMREDGRWALIPAGIIPGTPGTGAPAQPTDLGLGGGKGAVNPDGSPATGLEPAGGPGNDPNAGVILSEQVGKDTIGTPANTIPFRGVYSPTKETAIHSFLGKDNIAEWQFTVELISFQQQGTPDNPAFIRPFAVEQLGKPFPAGITPPIPQPTSNPAPAGGQPVQPGGDPNQLGGQQFPFRGNDGSGRDLRPTPPPGHPLAGGGN